MAVVAIVSVVTNAVIIHLYRGRRGDAIPQSLSSCLEYLHADKQREGTSCVDGREKGLVGGMSMRHHGVGSCAATI